MKGQVQELLQKIETMMMENGGMFIMEQMRRRHSMISIVNFAKETPAENEIDVKKNQKNEFGQIGICWMKWLDKNMHQMKQECQSLGLFVGAFIHLVIMLICFIACKKILRDPESDEETLMKVKTKVLLSMYVCGTHFQA
ncbi:GTPase IMAP family member 8-like protein [Labeo rohita]|uniref:GTPase IMAP family member 8-like protein n=1 Tax=Labeo rohita TaxID=84645 RepID=A0A498LUI9_LABRO|nr:GTPase IMAP family member 8-like protein [Labeo rohita]